VSIDIRNVFKKFGHVEILKGISLEILPGQLIAFLGPSGSGKTTLLRIIAGLEVPDYGEILLHGENVRLQKVSDRKVGFVFQHYALFRHMSVFENIAFGLRVKPKDERLPDNLIKNKIEELLRLERAQEEAATRDQLERVPLGRIVTGCNRDAAIGPGVGIIIGQARP
jgi:sulfate transport system ATP-binding protein